MISKGIVFSVIVILCTTFIQNSFAIPADPHFYVKGIANQYGPFAGNYVRVLADGERGTILLTTPHGLAVVRMDLSDAVFCYNKTLAVCLNGTVSSMKNFSGIRIGDMIRISVDANGKWQMITFLTGERSLSTFSAKLNPVKNLASDEIPQRFFFVSEKEDAQPTLVSYYSDEPMMAAIEKARQFTITHPTFAYDGMPQSLDVNLVSIIKSDIPVYVVQVNFDSEHPGYGNRTGQVLKNVVTPHTMIVMVSDYGVGSSIIDGVWDEFEQSWQK